MMRRLPFLLAVAILLAAVGLADAASPLHPEIVLLDADGRDVLDSGAPVSPARTCGECHDTAFIAGHSYHVAVGFDETFAPGSVHTARPWSFSPGMFGRWDAMRYRRLTIPGEERFDLGVADWIRTFGDRHVGGGPAYYARDGEPLTARVPGREVDPETHVLDDATLKPVPWDWAASGAVEMNCFLCHLPDPADDARIAMLASGRFGWAATATLANTGLVAPKEDGTWQYVKSAFDGDGLVPRETLALGDPGAANCGLCHGNVVLGKEPVQLRHGLKSWETESKGQIFSPQVIAASALNLEDKEARTYPWDVHAARLLECTSCHHSLNNPVSFAEAERSKPSHLAYDARRLKIGDYLTQPNHHFSKGESAQGNVARRLDGTMRRCENCHAAEAVHRGWLPNTRRHLETLLCESCHIPQVTAPARQSCDWTVLTPEREPRVEYRGAAGDIDDPATLLTGYEPVILPRHQKDGRVRHGPHNLCTGYFWVEGHPARPVDVFTLNRAYFAEDGAYRASIVQALDEDGDGALAREELKLDTEAKVEAVRARLVAEGSVEPRIDACIQPLSLHHGVVPGAFATRECVTCHSRESRMTRPFELATYVPFGVEPVPVADSNTRLPGRRYRTSDGRLFYEPVPTASGRYVIGHDRAGWIDTLGGVVVLATLLGVLLHAGLRAHHGKRRKESAA